MLSKERLPSEIAEFENNYRKIKGRFDDLFNVFPKVSSYGLILYLITKLSELTKEELSSMFQDLRLSLINALERREVNIVNNNEVEVRYKYAINPNVVNLFYSLDLVSELVDAVPKSSEIEVPGVGHAKAVSLEDLEGYAEKVGLSEPAETIFHNEIHNIRKRTSAYLKLLEGGNELYSFIYSVSDARPIDVLDEGKLKEIRDRCVKNVGKIDERNFYAHAGMERNVIAVSTEEMSVGYLVDFLGEVEKILKKVRHS